MFKEEKEEKCYHNNTTEIQNRLVCKNCGSVVYENENEIVIIKKKGEKSILKELDKYDFPSDINEEAIEIYNKRLGNNTFKWTTKSSVVFACVYLAYKNLNMAIDPKDIATKIGIKKKQMTKGIKQISSYYTGKEVEEEKYFEALDLVPSILEKLNIDSKYHKDIKEEIQSIHDKVINKSEVISRATPQSVCYSLIYYYLKKNEVDVKKADYVKLIGISIMTLMKLCKPMREICGECEL